jgi:hypothetical protein
MRMNELIGGEIVDILKAILRRWPYDRKPVSFRTLMIGALHHIPSIILTLANSTYCATLVYYQVCVNLCLCTIHRIHGWYGMTCHDMT